MIISIIIIIIIALAIVIVIIIIMTISSCGSQNVAPGCQAELERSEAQVRGGIPAGVKLGTPLLQSLGGRMFVGWWRRWYEKWNAVAWAAHMSVVASQITGKVTAFSIVCSGHQQRKHQSSTSLVTGGFPTQRAWKKVVLLYQNPIIR